MKKTIRKPAPKTAAIKLLVIKTGIKAGLKR